MSYRSNGKWYDLRDNGGGKLVGSDVAYGAGTVSYVTGTVAVTLGALPDVGGEIILNWGSRVNYINRASSTLPPLKIPLQLAQTGITPGTVVIKWNDGTARTATDDGKGNITGSATGSVRYQTGLINLEPTLLPAGGQIYTVDYAYGPPDVQEFPAPLRDINGNVPLTLSKANLRPNAVEVTWNLLYNPYDPVTMTLFPTRDPYKTVRDNGLGRMRDTLGADYGTVDYVTGIISLKTETTVGMPRALYAWVSLGNNAQGFAVRRFLFQGWEHFPVGANMPNDETAHVSVKYRTMDADSAITAPITTSALKFDLTNQYSENIVPGSVNFTLGGRTYFDRAGNLYYSLDVATGNAIKAGTLNYQSGEVTLDAWATAVSSTVSVKSLLTSMDGRPVDEVTFRAPVAPLRTGSVQVLATRLGGGLMNVSANTAGDFVGTDVSGHVDYDTGVVRLRFGSVVTAAGNETQVWYTAANVGTDGKVFKPAPVFANTIRFNAVGFTYLPLDADILGLDPVRLPQDGKVSIFRPGGFAVLGHTASVTATVSNGQVVNCARVRLSRVRVIGADGQVINTGYSADLEAGKVTFTSVSGYVQPVTIEHRIEDMVQVSDVQINGQLAFTRQVTHTYPFPGSFISSALVGQDLKARVSVLFDQATWDAVTYADSVVGSVAPGTYNDILTPLAVTNKGAVTEKWALRFTNTTTFDVIGEHVGTISSGTIATDTSPLNPATGSPYFTIKGIGWGSGWAVGNVLRFNTVGALFPVWIVRTIQQGPESVINDKFTILVRGDVDRP